MNTNPRLADVSCSPMRFQPGDRLLVKCKTKLSAYQKKRMKRTVEKWAGDIVEVLVLDLTDLQAFELEHITR